MIERNATIDLTPEQAAQMIAVFVKEGIDYAAFTSNINSDNVTLTTTGGF